MSKDSIIANFPWGNSVKISGRRRAQVPKKKKKLIIKLKKKIPMRLFTGRKQSR